MTRPALSTITNRVHEISQLPLVEDRHSAVEHLLPDLRAIAADDQIEPDTRTNLLTKALRAVDPRNRLRMAAPDGALRQLEDAIGKADLVRRGPGQPPIGDPTKVALPDHIATWLDQEAARRNLTGKSPRAAAIRAIVTEAYTAATTPADQTKED